MSNIKVLNTKDYFDNASNNNKGNVMYTALYPPGFINNHFSERQYAFHEEFTIPKQEWKEAFVAVIPRGRVWGENGAVITDSGQLLGDVSYEFGKHPIEHSFFKTSTFKKSQEISGKVAILASAGGGYFHWVFGVLPRIHLILKSGIRLDEIDKFVVSNRNTKFMKETLSYFGITEDKIIHSCKDFYIEADELIIPSLAWYRNSIPKWALDFLYSYSYNKNYQENPKNIYISREDAKRRKIVNEKEILTLLEKKGFKKVILSSFSVNEQARLFNNAEVIIASHGAGLSNIAFCNDKVKLIEIFSESYINPCYYIICNHKKIDYNYLVGKKIISKEKHPLYDDIFVDTKKLLMMLDNLSVR
ncbi:MAG: glycosyltransferase family 61 protein [archaeon]